MTEPKAAARWSTRFLESMEVMGLESFWRTGRRNTQMGRILSVSLSKSVVVALLQAPGDEPYRARIVLRAFGGADWARVERELAASTVYAAKLLSGTLPLDIEEVFDELGLPLLPRTTKEVAMDCTCPDWVVPCEHLSVVCLRLAERFDTDPFEILAWRGRDRVDLLERLASLRARKAPPPPPVLAEPTSPPLSECLDSFWGFSLSDNESAAPAPSFTDPVHHPDAFLDQVAPPDFADALRPLYRALSTPPP